ncbi:MAG: preprotein translocase subunit SecG [Alphaproteobacteria bacterium]
MESVLQTTLLALHLVIVIALVAFILLQPSEGGGLGMGGGDGMSGFMTGRSKANFFTRTTAILATGFFLTTLIIGIITGQGKDKASLIDVPEGAQSTISIPADSSDIPAIGDVPAIGNLPADEPAAISVAPTTDTAVAPTEETIAPDDVPATASQ